MHGSTGESGFCAGAGLLSLVFCLTYEPWAARDPSSPRFVGIGAFNLVRSSAYRSIGGHRPIALRPDDDMKLRKVLKEAGFRQGFALGRTLLEVEWYGSLSELIRGLRKNVFAAADYRLGAVVAGSAALLLLFVWPFLALLVTQGPALILHGLTVAAVLGVYAGHARHAGTRPAHAPAVPLAALVALYATWRAVLLTLVTGRVTWRSTSYPLDELEGNRV